MRYRERCHLHNQWTPFAPRFVERHRRDALEDVDAPQRHSAAPTFPGVTAPPAGVAFDTPEQIRVRASRIAERVVAQQTMPLGNVTGITPEERDLLGRWIQAGARLR